MPDVAVFRLSEEFAKKHPDTGGYLAGYYYSPNELDIHGPYPTEEEALLAAYHAGHSQGAVQ